MRVASLYRTNLSAPLTGVKIPPMLKKCRCSAVVMADNGQCEQSPLHSRLESCEYEFGGISRGYRSRFEEMDKSHKGAKISGLSSWALEAWIDCAKLQYEAH
jgi:hypothetical protein